MGNLYDLEQFSFYHTRVDVSSGCVTILLYLRLNSIVHVIKIKNKNDFAMCNAFHLSA